MERKSSDGDDPSGWSEVWTGQEPTAEAAEEMLHGNGLEVHRRNLGDVHLSVPNADAETARELLKDWGL